MMNKCKKIAVIDIFPEPLERVKDIIEKAIFLCYNLTLLSSGEVAESG